MSWTAPAAAQSAPADRDESWKTVTTVTMVAAAGTQLLMPRVFYSDPEATVGWKARWHVSVLAPALTLVSLTVLNEHALKDAFGSYRPGCDEASQGGPGCGNYGGPSTHAFGAFAALGHGAGVFLVDTLKWSDGRLNGWALAGNVGAPLIFAVVTAVGRSAGNWESGGQVLAGSALGLGVGALTGVAYGLLQRPECSYGAGIVCW